MARTHKDSRHTQAARTAYWNLIDALPVGAWIGQFRDYRDQPYTAFQNLRGGNMVMGHRPSGIWDDCRASDSTGRKMQRRNQKRRERQQWKRNIEQEV